MKDGFRSGAWIAALVFSMAGCATAPTDQDTPEPALEPEPVAEPAPAPEREPLVVKPQAPEQYVVKKGDTLWDISSSYLVDPWRWPELWHVNPQVRNPHLIYPGDVLILTYVDGRPRVQVQAVEGVESAELVTVPGGAAVTPSGTLRTVKVVPRVRVEPLEAAIPTIPYDAIAQFLSRPRVVTRRELDDAPYILSAQEEHLIAGPDYPIYVRGLEESEEKDFVVVRMGEAYEDDGEILGYEAIHVADAQLQREGDPATVILLRAKREALVGDRLVPSDNIPTQNYLPHPPDREVEGRIVGVMGGVSQVGQFQVVAISKGAQDEMEPGHVLAIYQSGGRARDPYTGSTVRLPRERAGTLMVFRVFERVSYALVMDATRAIHLHDTVTNP